MIKPVLQILLVVTDHLDALNQMSCMETWLARICSNIQNSHLTKLREKPTRYFKSMFCGVTVLHLINSHSCQWKLPLCSQSANELQVFYKSCKCMTNQTGTLLINESNIGVYQ